MDVNQQTQEQFETNEKYYAVITGAGSGIGYATALKFASKKFNIACLDISKENLQKISDELKKTYPQQKFLSYQVDVTKEEEVKKCFEEIFLNQFGRIDICFNCAGIEGERNFTEKYSTEIFDQVIETNLKGVGSFPEFAPYCASKWAIIGLTKSVAAEYASQGIRINVIAPGTTKTPMVERFQENWPEWQKNMNEQYKIGRISLPEEVAETVFFLSSDKAPFIIGDPIILGGGATV